MKTRKKEKEIVEKILNKVMESGILLNGNGHFAVYTYKGDICSIEIFDGLFSAESKVGVVGLRILPTISYKNDREVEYDFRLRLNAKSALGYNDAHLLKNESEVLRKFFEYLEENKHKILQCDYEHGCSLFVTDVDFI